MLTSHLPAHKLLDSDSAMAAVCLSSRAAAAEQQHHQQLATAQSSQAASGPSFTSASVPVSAAAGAAPPPALSRMPTRGAASFSAMAGYGAALSSPGAVSGGGSGLVYENEEAAAVEMLLEA
jgi:hypothetical protein